jgi:uroporphyrinogen decarboxylase
MAGMNSRERVMAAIRGEAVDRPPLSFWGHDFLREWSAAGLADAMIEPVETFGYDYLKVNPRATYYAEAWGAAYRPSNDAARGPETESFPLGEASDLGAVETLDGSTGAFAEQLKALRLIGARLGGEVPFIQTVFSPLSVVARLADSREPVRRWMTEAPEALHGALRAVAQTLASYSRACLDAGADGVFFATTEWATPEACMPKQYDVFGRPYDLEVLNAVRDAPFNVLHVCRPNNMLERLLDYPTPVVNWAAHAPGNASLRDVLAQSDKTVMGGVDERHALLQGSPDDVRAQVSEALRETDGRRFLVAAGCSISPQTPPENIHAAVAAVKDASQ